MFVTAQVTNLRYDPFSFLVDTLHKLGEKQPLLPRINDFNWNPHSFTKLRLSGWLRERIWEKHSFLMVPR